MSLLAFVSFLLQRVTEAIQDGVPVPVVYEFGALTRQYIAGNLQDVAKIKRVLSWLNFAAKRSPRSGALQNSCLTQGTDPEKVRSV